MDKIKKIPQISAKHIFIKCRNTEFYFGTISQKKENATKNKAKISLLSIFYYFFSFFILSEGGKKKIFFIYRKNSNGFLINKKREACKDSTHISDYFSRLISVCPDRVLLRDEQGQVCRERVLRHGPEQVCREQV